MQQNLLPARLPPFPGLLDDDWSASATAESASPPEAGPPDGQALACSRSLIVFRSSPQLATHSVCLWAHTLFNSACFVMLLVAAAVLNQGTSASSKLHLCARCPVQLSKTSRPQGYAADKFNIDGRVCPKCYDTLRGKKAGSSTPSSAPSTPVKQRKPRDAMTPEQLRLTPDQRRKLDEGLKADGFGKQGRSLSATDTRRVLKHVDSMAELAELAPPGSISGNKVVTLTSSAFGISPNTLSRALRRFRETGEVQQEQKERMSIDDPRHSLFGMSGPTLKIWSLVHSMVEEASKNNKYLSLNTMRTKLLSELGEDVPKSTLHAWMQQMGLEWGEKKLTGLSAKLAHAKIRKYILDYSQLLRRARDPNDGVVLVWMDESYIHQGYCSRYSWFLHDDDVVPHRVRGQDKGKRLIIMHAMTKDGMLDCLPLGAKMNDNLGAKVASACVVTGKLSAEGVQPEDYHDTLNGEKFVAWLQNRLIPAFEKKYGKRRRMVLILDNAKYHHARGIDWVNVNSMTRVALGNYLRLAKVKQITVERKNKEGEMEKKVIKASKFTADSTEEGGGPKKKELLPIVKDYVKSHPVINTTLVQQAMKAKGHELLYTPPYESWLQPIELVWAQVKQQVATQSSADRKVGECAEQTLAALRSITPDDCKKKVEHTHKLMDTWISSKKSGSLREFGSLEQLSRATQAELAAVTDLPLADAPIVGDAAEGKENVAPMEE